MSWPNRTERHVRLMNINPDRNFEPAPEWDKWVPVTIDTLAERYKSAHVCV